LELPGEIAETIVQATPISVETAEVSRGNANTEPRRVSLTSVARPRGEGPPREGACPGDEGRVLSEAETNADIDGGPSVTKETADPKPAHAETTAPLSERESQGTEIRTGGTTGSGNNIIKATTTSRVLRDIDLAMVMREHMAGISPELATANSFIDAVCGRSYASGSGEATRPVVADPRVSGRVATPTPPTVTAERAKPPTFAPNVEGLAIRGRERGGGDVESDSDRETTEVVIVEDTEMSEGEVRVRVREVESEFELQ